MNSRSALIRAKFQRVPIPALVLAVGIGTLGVSTYLFLLVAGRSLGDHDYAPLGALWMLVFLLCPGIFFPVEQELGRAIAARTANGNGAWPVIRRAIALTVASAAGLAVLALALVPVYFDQLFDGQALLLLAFMTCIASFAAEYVVRGVLAGSQRLDSYGIFISAIGAVRVIAAIVLGTVGFDLAGPYGLVVGVAPILAVGLVFVLPKYRPKFESGTQADWSELTRSIGILVAGSIISQALVNSAPLFVKYMTDVSQQALAGAFTKAVILTRIPLFLFQAVQAAMLPRLSHQATVGDIHGFRRTLNAVLIGLVVLCIVSMGGAALVGDFALRTFGSGGVLSRADIVILALGNGVFLLGLAVAQALVAVCRQTETVVSWLGGLVVFVGLSVAPIGSVVTRVEWALVAGAAASFVLMSAFLYSRPLAVSSKNASRLDEIEPLSVTGSDG